MSCHNCYLGYNDTSNNGVCCKENREPIARYLSEVGSKFCDLNATAGMRAGENDFWQTTDARRLYQQNEMLRPISRLNCGNGFSDIIDASFVEELEQISTRLVQLLNKIKKTAERTTSVSFFGDQNDKPLMTNDNAGDMQSAVDTPADAEVKKNYETSSCVINDKSADLQILLQGQTDRHRHEPDRIQQLKDKLTESDLEIIKMMVRIKRLELLTATRLAQKCGQDVMK